MRKATMGQAPGDWLKKLTELLTQYVVPLYIDIKSVPVHVGSGFFVRTSGRHFLVTAAHVMDQRAFGPIFYYAAPNLARHLDGFVRTVPFDGDRSKDKVDVAVVQMSNIFPPPYPQVRKLVVDLHELRPRALPRSGKTYMVLGFPTTKNEAHRVRAELPAEAWSYHSDSMPPEAYVKRGLTENLHVLMAFDARVATNFDGTRIRFPKPKGMSGAPIWQITDEGSSDEFGQFGFPVVAVATEYSTAGRLIQGTDISVAAHLIGTFLADRPA